jgi:aromatic-L-amino-acid decarboxylase
VKEYLSQKQVALADGCEDTRNRFNLALLKRIVKRGKIYLSNAELKGRFCLRACIVNHLTKDTDIDVVVPEVLDTASEILPEYK